MHVIVAAAALVAAFSAPETAFAQYDPSASRAENQVGSISRSLSSQTRSRATQQQYQFETNAIRSQVTRPAPPPLVPSPMAAPIRR